ncbi:MAG: branched-chain amino acid ABC transporter permease [Homoserinimonas sp.]
MTMEHKTSSIVTNRPPEKRNTVGAWMTRIFENKHIGWAALAIALLMPFITATPYSLNVMTTAAIFVVLAAGLNIVVGYCGLLDLGYIAFLAVGAYTAGILSKMFELPVLFTLPAVIVMTILAGLIIGAPTLRLRSDYLAIVTLGFGEITRITANNLTITGGPSGIFGIPGLLVVGDFDFQHPVIFYYVTVLIVAGLVLAAARLGKSRLGRAWKFVKEDEDAAEAMGIHTYKVKLLAYIFGAIWGGFGGILFASHLTAVSPMSFLFLQSALVLMAVVLGGMGNMKGVVIGALIISLLPELLRDLAEYRYLMFGVLLVIVMVFRPQGLWPPHASEAERTQARLEKAEIKNGMAR